MAVFVNHGEIMPHCSGNTAKTNFGRKECTADVAAEAAQWNTKSSGWVFRAVFENFLVNSILRRAKFHLFSDFLKKI